MTNEQWKEVDEQLQTIGSCVKLLIDGYNIDLVLTQTSQFENDIVVYVDGKFKFKWLTEDCEERRRFCAVKKQSLVNSKDFKAYGIKNKKQQEALRKNNQCCTYFNWWHSFRSLKKHLIENNKSIEYIESIYL